MEQKRTLWILIAAGIFLCVVFGAAFFMSRAANEKKDDVTAISLKDSDDIWIAPYSESSRPKTTGESAKKDDVSSAVTSSSKDEKPVESSQTEIASLTGSSLTEGLEYPAEGKSTATIEPSQASAQNSKDAEKSESQSVASDGRVTTTFDFTSGNSAASSVTAQNKAAEKAMKNADTRRGEMAKTMDESTKASKTSSEKSVASAKPAESKTAASSKPAVASTSSKAAKEDGSSKIPDRYWVQAASYSSKKKADEARAVLDKNMVQCEVFTFEMDGTLYYRVRVGPYTTKTEAAYWKKQVDSMEQFADAGTYIVNSSAPIAKK
ncbi:MAG: SPOR domain-containing protein [Treponema sp.]|nr:SPOR domain-containing protein [Treponema sp.]